VEFNVIHRSVLILAAALAFSAPAAIGQSVGKDARVNLRVENRALSEIVDYIRQQTGANLVILPGEYPAVSLELADVPWRDALHIAAEAAGGVVEERTGGVLVIEKPVRVRFEFSGADVTEVINTIATLSGANIVTAPEVKGAISLRLNDVPWRDALDVTVKTLGFTVIEDRRGILRVVDPITLQAQMVTKSYQLRYIRPSSRFRPNIKSEFLLQAQMNQQAQGQDITKRFNVLEALKKALSPGGELDFIESQNVIIVRDTDQVHEQIRAVVERLDIEPPQVFCDVKFVSSLNSDLRDIGVDYGDAGPRIGVSGGQVPTTLPFGLGGGDWEDIIAVSQLGHQAPLADPSLALGSVVAPSTIFGSLSFTGVNATLKMLQRDTTSEVIQAPKLIALDGSEATIFVGETIRYAEARSEQGQAGGLQLSLSEAQNSPVDVGFQLLVVPHVISGTNQLTLQVIPKETSLSGTGQSALAPQGFDVFTVGASGLEGSIALPRTRSSTILTSMLLESGQTAVIGGLTTDNDTETDSRVPWLADIPILGEAFKYNKRERQRRSLLVFITPTIVHSASDTERILQNEFLRRRTRLAEEVDSLISPETRALLDERKAAAKKKKKD
jgi:type II secretory pathway component GspD/PulD (secretin)